MKTTRTNEDICLVFTIETNVKNVINRINLVTSANISNAEVLYLDEHGYSKVSKVLSNKKTNEGLELTFESFYSKKFDLVIKDEILEEDIKEIKIVQIDQYKFYEDKDVDVRLDKTIMTAETLCGQHASHSPNLAIDGKDNTYFHSGGYSGFGDFTVQLGDEFLIGGVRFSTRADNDGTGNGRIRCYEVLYKTSLSEEWKKVSEQLTEEPGLVRVSTFKPVLATEICLRVTNGKNKFVYITEMDIFKYSLVDERIRNLFTDDSENEIKEETTIEEIDALEKELITPSYLKRVMNAKKMYFKKLLRKYFEIELNGITDFDKVYFKSDEKIASADLKYVDKNGVEKLISCEVIKTGKNYVLNIERIETEKATIVLYGVKNIAEIETNSYIQKDKMSATSNVSTYGNNTPSLILDGNESTYFHSNQYKNPSGDVYISLEEPEIISKLNLKTDHPTAKNGEIYQYDILYKESKASTVWKKIFSSDRNESAGWKFAEFPEIFATDLCIRVNESYGNWILINEIDVCANKSDLKVYLEKIYTDKTCTAVREGIKLRDIEKLIEIYPESNLGVKAKMLWINDNNLDISEFKIAGTNKNYSNYENVLRMEKCIDLISTQYKIDKKTDYLIESNKDVKLCFISSETKTPTENIVEIRAGKNMLYSKNIYGDIFVLREDTEELTLTLYNTRKSDTHYKVGEYNINELMKRKSSENLVTIEGKNFIMRGDVNWILENLDEHQFIDSVRNLDYVIDYLYLLIDKNEKYTTEYSVPNLKRIFWQNSAEKTSLKYADTGSYIEFKENFGFLLRDKMENLINEELSNLLSEQMISKEIYGPAICSFIKTILKKIILLKNIDVIDIQNTPIESLGTKLFLFSNNDRMITSVYKTLVKEELGQSNNVIMSKICLSITKYLERDISSYFTGIGIELEPNILDECRKYIEPTININDITFQNYKELVKEEREKFNQNYTSLVNRNGGDTVAK
ncbi:MAG: discoidin domain-containing protein [Cetobacterium sp.]